MACVKRSSNKWLRDFIMSFHEDFLTTSCSFRLIKRIPGLGWPSVLCFSAAAPFFFTNNNIASARGLVIGHPCGGGGKGCPCHSAFPCITRSGNRQCVASNLASRHDVVYFRLRSLRSRTFWLRILCWGASGWRVFGGGASGWRALGTTRWLTSSRTSSSGASRSI